MFSNWKVYLGKIILKGLCDVREQRREKESMGVCGGGGGRGGRGGGCICGACMDPDGLPRIHASRLSCMQQQQGSIGGSIPTATATTGKILVFPPFCLIWIKDRQASQFLRVTTEIR